MITTTAAGRTWHFDRSLGRPTNEINGDVGGFRYPTDLTIAPDGIIFVLSKGFQLSEQMERRDTGRIGKTTFDEHHLGDFARQDFTWPGGIALDSEGWVYATDEHDNVVRKYDPDGVVPYPGTDSVDERIAVWGESGSQPGQLNGPNGIAFDADDNLIVVESRSERVQKFTKDGQYISGFGSSGSAPGQFRRPWGVTVDSGGHIYVADWGNSRVQKFTNEGEYVMTFGEEFGGELNHPANVAVDSQGDVYITDWGNRRVQVYEPDGEILAAFQGDATTLSKAGEYIIRRDPGTIKAYRQVKDYTPMGRFQRPTGIEVDEHDRIIVADACGRLQVYAKDHAYVEPEVKLELE